MACISTRWGVMFDIINPTPEMVLIEDIAHALSRICRYGGHIEDFYSVADHSVRVSHLVPSEYAMQALLHDSAEAYMGDMVSPLKAHFPEFTCIENHLLSVIMRKFGQSEVLHESVKRADMIMLATEKRDLKKDPNDWGLPVHPLPAPLPLPRTISESHSAFMERFYYLKDRV